MSCNPASITNTRSVAVNPANTLVYFGLIGTNQVNSCPIQSDGSIGTCVDSSPNQTFYYPNGLGFNPGGDHLYVTHVNPGLYVCDINLSTGVADPCVLTGSVDINPYSLGVVVNSTNTIAYVTDANGNVYLCAIGSGGAFTSCQSNATISGAYGVAIQGNYLYVTTQQNDVYKCSISSVNGSLSACSTTGGSIFGASQGIAINAAGSVAYIVDSSNSPNLVKSCDIAVNTGDLSNCVDQTPTSVTISTLSGIAISK